MNKYRLALPLLCGALLAGCVSSPYHNPTLVTETAPSPNSIRLAAISPNISIYSLGVNEFKRVPSQSENANRVILDEAIAHLKEQGYNVQALPTTDQSLQQAVATYQALIRDYNFFQRQPNKVWKTYYQNNPIKLPYPLTAAQQSGASHILFLYGSETNSTGGRVALNALLLTTTAVVGVPVTLTTGQSNLGAAIVNVNTGDVAWVNGINAGNLDRPDGGTKRTRTDAFGYAIHDNRNIRMNQLFDGFLKPLEEDKE